MTWEVARVLIVLGLGATAVITFVVIDKPSKKVKYSLAAVVIVLWVLMHYFTTRAKSQTLKTWCEARNGHVEYVTGVGNVCLVEKP